MLALLFFQSPQNLYDQANESYDRKEFREAIVQYKFAASQFLVVGDSLMYAHATNDAGLCFYHLGILDSARTYYQLALMSDRQRKDTIRISGRLRNLAIVLKQQGRFEQAASLLLESIQYAKAVDQKAYIASALNSIGNIYLDQESYTEALAYFKKSVKLKEHLNKLNGLAISLNNIGLINHKLGRYDSALHYYHAALNSKRNLKNPNPGSLAHTFHNIGITHLELKNLDSSHYFLDSAYELRAEQNDLEGIATSNLGLAQYHVIMKNYALARQLLALSEFHARQQTNRKLLLDCLELWKRIYRELGNWEAAFQYSEQQAALNDSIFNEEKIRVFQTVAEQQLEERNSALQIAQQEVRIASAERNQQRIRARNNQVIATLLGLSALMAIVAFGLIRNQRRKVLSLNEELRLRNEKIAYLNKQNMHFTKNALTEITGLLNFQSQKLEGAAKELMLGAKLRLETINILYHQLFGRPDQEGPAINLSTMLAKVLHNTLDSLLDHESQVERKFILGELYVDNEVALNLGLIINELTINSCKYAFVNSQGIFTAMLTQEGAYFLLTVGDNGPGIPDTVDWKHPTSFGLQLIKLLVEEMNADLCIENQSQGLNIEIKVPYPTK